MSRSGRDSGDWGTPGQMVTHERRNVPVRRTGTASPWQLAAKRVIDVLGAAFGLLISSPVIVVACIAIRLEDGGPALYRQVRIGLNGRPFEVYKLRTMTPDADMDVDPAGSTSVRTVLSSRRPTIRGSRGSDRRTAP